ncbi:hypothetical protein Q9L58_005858 [Maublancomyces gigas]|uniref:Uncharacterized protein n=1 Tax=Discina gigas TaxID=1032678 RepID=A0ABR3GGY1_9PEZI
MSSPSSDRPYFHINGWSDQMTACDEVIEITPAELCLEWIISFNLRGVDGDGQGVIGVKGAQFASVVH